MGVFSRYRLHRRGVRFAPRLGFRAGLRFLRPPLAGDSGLLRTFGNPRADQPDRCHAAAPATPKELIHAHSYGNDRTTSLRGDGTVRHDFLASHAPCIRFGHLPLSDGRLFSERAPSPQHSLPRRLDCLSLLTCSWERPFHARPALSSRNQIGRDRSVPRQEAA